MQVALMLPLSKTSKVKGSRGLHWSRCAVWLRLWRRRWFIVVLRLWWRSSRSGCLLAFTLFRFPHDIAAYEGIINRISNLLMYRIRKPHSRVFDKTHDETGVSLSPFPWRVTFLISQAMVRAISTFMPLRM